MAENIENAERHRSTDSSSKLSTSRSAAVSISLGIASLLLLPLGSASAFPKLSFVLGLAGVFVGTWALLQSTNRRPAIVGIFISSLCPLFMLLLFSGGLGWMFVSH